MKYTSCSQKSRCNDISNRAQHYQKNINKANHHTHLCAQHHKNNQSMTKDSDQEANKQPDEKKKKKELCTF